jgi:hypothetical protein
MRTTVILAAGLLLLASAFLFARLFTQHYPAATTWATGAFLALWLLATGFNLWVGINKAGYSFRDEFPIMLLLFLVPAAAAILTRWKWG